MLERQLSDFERNTEAEFDALDRAKNSVLRVSDVRTSAIVGVGQFVRADTTIVSTLQLRLRAPRMDEAGQSLVVAKLKADGTVTIATTPGVTINGAETLALTAVAGVEIHCDGANYWTAEIFELGTVPLSSLDPTGGADGDVVTLVGGVPAWATPSASGPVPIELHDTTHSPEILIQMQGDAVDSSGNGLDMTVSGYTSFGAVYPGVLGFQCDSVSSMNRAGHDSSLLLQGAMTVEFIGVVADPSVADETLISFGLGTWDGTAANNFQYKLEVKKKAGGGALPQLGLRWLQQNSSPPNDSTYDSGTPLPLGTVFHCAVTRSASQVIKIYINGTLRQTSGALTAPTGGTGGRLCFFQKAATTGTEICEGMTIASMKIIASELTAAEVKAEFNRTLGVHYGALP